MGAHDRSSSDWAAVNVEVIGVKETAHASGLILSRVVKHFIVDPEHHHGLGIVLALVNSEDRCIRAWVAVECHKGWTMVH